MEKYVEYWLKTKERLKETLHPQIYNESFSYIDEVHKFRNNHIYLVVKDTLAKFRIQKFYLNTMNSILSEFTDEKLDFEFITKEEAEKEKQNDGPTITRPDTITPITRRNIRPEYTFENFVTGENNRYAFLTAMKAAESPYDVANPLYIFGDVGLGKTHLMMALANYILDNNNKANVVYTTAQQFAEDYFTASSKKTSDKYDQFHEYYRNADVLLVDDIQFLSGKNGTQEEFFKLFEILFEKNKQIVITSDRPANELENIMARLKSRFAWGLPVDIKKPDFEHRKLITKKKLSFLISDPHSVPEDVIEYIALNFDENVRMLEGAIRRLVTYCATFNSPITLEIAESALDSIIEKTKNDITPSNSTQAEKIKQVVANYYNIDVKELAGNSKKKEIAWARQMAMYLIRTQLNMPLKNVGSLFGGRDHTTVVHAENKINGLIKEDWAVKTDVDFLCQKLEK